MTPFECEGFHARGAVPFGARKLIMIDDHAILRDGLRALMGGQLDLEVVGEAANIAAGIELAGRLRPDIVIIDVSFPRGSGIDAIDALRSACPGAMVIVLTVHDSLEYRRAALRAGADEFVAKHAPFEVLLRAIRSVGPGADRTGQLRGALQVSKSSPGARILTRRERQVLVGVAQGYTSRRIAENLGRSVKTVVKHRSNMMRKLSLHDASAVTRFAVSSGLLPADAGPNTGDGE
jgi:DNA-binding NarL/FixJ family response regulator